MITPKQYEKIVGKRIRYDILLKYETAVKLIKKHTFKGKNYQMKILDVGCGHMLFCFFADKRWTVVGLDNDKNRIKKANAIKRKNTYFYNDDIENEKSFFYIDKHQFDIVLCLDVLEHLNHPERALKNIYKRLDDDGILIVSNPNKYSFWNVLNNIFHLEDHKYYWSPEKFTEMAGKFGFELVEVAPRPLLSEGIGFALKDYRKIEKLDIKLGRLLPRFTTGWFLVFRKKQ